MKKLILATALLLNPTWAWCQISEQQTQIVEVCYRISDLIPEITKLRDLNYPQSFAKILVLKGISNEGVRTALNTIIETIYANKEISADTFKTVFLSKCINAALK